MLMCHCCPEKNADQDRTTASQLEASNDQTKMCNSLQTINYDSKLVAGVIITHFKDFHFALCILLVWQFKTRSLNTRMYASAHAQ